MLCKSSPRPAPSSRLTWRIMIIYYPRGSVECSHIQDQWFGLIIVSILWKCIGDVLAYWINTYTWSAYEPVRSKMHHNLDWSIANNIDMFKLQPMVAYQYHRSKACGIITWGSLFGYQSSQGADRIDVHDLVIISKWMPENKQGLRRWEQVGGYGRWIVWHTGSKY